MNPVEHLLIGWAAANAIELDRRDRILVTIGGIVPDLDGFGLLPELLTRGSAHELFWWTDYHHTLCHNLAFALLYSAFAALVAHRRRASFLMAFVTVHLHLLGDLVGARGPDGYQWPIPYLLPFSERWTWSWSGQWALNAWQNFAITIPLLLWTLWFEWKRGRSPLEMVSLRADSILIDTLRARFGNPG
jgi:inner membrane protein